MSSPAGITQAAKGDILNFQLVRTGATGELQISHFEFEWDPFVPQNASIPSWLYAKLFGETSPISLLDVWRGPSAYLKDPRRL